MSGGSLAARFGPQSSDSFEEYPAVTNRTHADFLCGVLLGQVREDPFVDLVVAESRLVFFEAKARSQTHDVHNSAPNSGLLHIIVWSGESVSGDCISSGHRGVYWGDTPGPRRACGYR